MVFLPDDHPAIKELVGWSPMSGSSLPWERRWQDRTRATLWGQCQNRVPAEPVRVWVTLLPGQGLASPASPQETQAQVLLPTALQTGFGTSMVQRFLCRAYPTWGQSHSLPNLNVNPSRANHQKISEQLSLTLSQPCDPCLKGASTPGTPAPPNHGVRMLCKRLGTCPLHNRDVSALAWATGADT